MMSTLRKMILRHLILCNIAIATARSNRRNTPTSSPSDDEESSSTGTESSDSSYGFTCDYNEQNHELILKVDLENIDDEESYLNAIDLKAKLNLKGISQSATWILDAIFCCSHSIWIFLFPTQRNKNMCKVYDVKTTDGQFVQWV